MRGRYLVLLAAVLLLPLIAIAPAFAQVQVPLNPLNIPQFAQPLPLLAPLGAPPAPGTAFVPYIPFTLGGTVGVNQAVDIKLCEFQTAILPPNTIQKGKTPLTWVWGYQIGTGACTPLPGHSYLGPVVLAKRGTPTQMTFRNKLPDAAAANVQAYKLSTDQTLIWGDPLSLNTAPPPINLLGTETAPGSGVLYDSELNLCYAAAKTYNPVVGLPAPCLDNYGFFGGPPASTYIAPIPAAVHIHGGEVPAVLDGGPDAWWTPNGIYGHGYYSKNGINDLTDPQDPGKAIYVYPNHQEAAPVWFHDHILGATRLNVYAGIAGGYMITDDQLSSPATLPPGLLPLGLDRKQGGAPMNGTLDLTAGADEVLIPLIIQDRMFDTKGQLYFPAVGINPEHPYWIPEFVGDTIAVNGAVWPLLKIEPKRYRFLVLNGSNARTYELAFTNTRLPTKTRPSSSPAIYVIGNDQGYLDTPQLIPAGAALANKLVVMPGERYEIIVDFGANAGDNIILTNTANVPYGPLGVPPNPLTDGRVMQFKVNSLCPSNQCGSNDTSYNPANGGTIRIANPTQRLADLATFQPAAGVTVHKTRRLTLNEVLAPPQGKWLGGPLEILVNNTLYDGTSTRTFGDFTPVTSLWNTTQYSELPHEGETELWEIVNLTVDAHPIHPHLVAFQVLNRQTLLIDPNDLAGKTLYENVTYNGAFPGGAGFIPGFGPPLDYNCGNGAPGRGPVDPNTCVFGGNPVIPPEYLGPMVPPSPQEIGWKDTVMAPPAAVTRILVRFAKTEYAPDALSDAIGYDFDPGEGHGYVWHCHIIDHEDNEMMRPYQVQANPGVVHTYLSGPGNQY
jgi:FtsP/CotA-like multicopper oxidase with cupredoxin domain